MSSIIFIHHMSNSLHGFGPNIDGYKTLSLGFKPTKDFFCANSSTTLKPRVWITSQATNLNTNYAIN